MISEASYLRIKHIIRKNISLTNGYLLDDLVQDTIIKLIAKYQNENEYPNICVKVAKNLIIDYYRKKEQYKEIYDKEPEQECYQKEFKLKHVNYNCIVPEKYRSLAILRYKFKLKYSEIATFYEIPLGTVKGRMFKMKKEIKLLNDL